MEGYINEALKNGENVLLVVPEILNLDEVQLNLDEINVVRWVHDYQKAVIDRIEKIITNSEDYNLKRSRSMSVDSGIDVFE